MDVSVMFLAGPTTLDLGFDWVTVRDVFHGLLFGEVGAKRFHN